MSDKTKKSVYLSDLHFEHKNWLSEIEYWKDELKFFKNRLSEVVSRWSDKDILARCEQYQNQFIMHREILDILRHDIKAHENELEEMAVEHPVAINHRRFEDHTGLRDRVETQRDIYNSMKKSYFVFLTESM